MFGKRRKCGARLFVWLTAAACGIGIAAEPTRRDSETGSPAVAPAAAPPPQRFEFSRRLMGMDYRVLLYATDSVVANRVLAAVWDRIAALDKALSDYDPESEAMRLCRQGGPGTPVAVGDDLWRVLTVSRDWSLKSDGAFDVTVGPLVRQWRRARRQKQLPTAEQLLAAKQAVGYQLVALHEASRQVELARDDMRLDFGGIAVGYAVDDALRLIESQGVHAALVDGSGDVGVIGAPPGAAGWHIDVAPRRSGPEAAPQPGPYVELKDGAISTSGDAYQAVEIDGVRYSHIVNPTTGLGLTMPSSVTIVARDCTTADALATAVSVLGPERGLKLVATVPGAVAYIVRLENGQPLTVVSPGALGTVFKQP